MDALWRIAQALNRAAAPPRLLPPLLFVTDPERTPEPERIAERLPRGAGVIFRGFGAPDAAKQAQGLSEIARERGLVLLVGLDAELAEAVDADGVHLPERALLAGPELRKRRPDWLITGAAHSAGALEEAADAGLDAALLSPVFESRSPSAGRALGEEAFSALVRTARLPVYGLGGIDAGNAGLLADSGAAGIAAVEGVLTEYGD